MSESKYKNVCNSYSENFIIFYVFIMPSFNFNNILLFHAGLLKCLPFRVNKIYVSFSPIGGIEYWGFIYMPQMRMHIICMNVTTK